MATLDITKQQVYRLERRGKLRPRIEGMARLYGLDEVRRLARERRRQAATDGRVSAPSDEGMAVLDGLSNRHDICAALTREGVQPEDAFLQVVVTLADTTKASGRAPTPAEWRLVNTLADLAVRSRGGDKAAV